MNKTEKKDLLLVVDMLSTERAANGSAQIQTGPPPI